MWAPRGAGVHFAHTLLLPVAWERRIPEEIRNALRLKSSCANQPAGSAIAIGRYLVADCYFFCAQQNMLIDRIGAIAVVCRQPSFVGVGCHTCGSGQDHALKQPKLDDGAQTGETHVSVHEWQMCEALTVSAVVWPTKLLEIDAGQPEKGMRPRFDFAAARKSNVAAGGIFGLLSSACSIAIIRACAPKSAGPQPSEVE